MTVIINNTSFTIQYLGLFIFVYFMSMPMLAAMVADVPSSHRSDVWVEPLGWLWRVKPMTRIIIATAVTASAYLIGVFNV